MKLTFRFFGRFSQDLADFDFPEQFDEPLAVGQLREQIARLAPAVGDRLRQCMIAVNADYTDDERVLRDGDEVAFLPPVSGG